jgi:hypothetical protein
MMSPRLFKLLVLIAIGLALPTMVLIATPQQDASAQCGSQASSCKNCHEVQGKDPISQKGPWHIDHAANDYCEFCHAGNVQATDKDKAHVGMVNPGDNLKQSCGGMCHQDYQARADKYIAAGMKVGGGAAQPPAAPSGGQAPAATAPATQPAQPAAQPAAPAAPPKPAAQPPASGQIVDFNQPKPNLEANPSTVNVGNIVLGVLVVLMLIVGVAIVFAGEGGMQKLAAWQTQPAVASAYRGTPLPDNWTDLVKAKPELAEVLPMLARADSRTIKAIARVLSDPSHGDEALQALGKIDLKLIEDVRKLGPRERELLLALAQGH